MKIDQQEVLRYLGYRNQRLDEAMEMLIAKCLVEIKAVLRKDVVYNTYNLEKQGNHVKLISTNLIFPSKDLSKRLQYSDRCALMAATLGLETDQRIASYSRLDLTKGIVMDACATAAIEALCDEAQAEIRRTAAREGYAITNRYSPGYGDLSITHQKDILEVLKAYTRIGLTVNENYIMLPRKSVTALIGLEKREARTEKAAAKDKCDGCQAENCRYRKGGVIDEKKA